MRILAVAVVILLASGLQAQDLKDVSHSTMYLAVGADLGTTFYGVLKDKRQEANPLLHTFKVSDVRKRTFVQGGAVIGLTVAADFAAHKLEKAGHWKIAAFSRFLISGTHFYGAYQNLK